jgi:hypothetical protein
VAINFQDGALTTYLFSSETPPAAVRRIRAEIKKVQQWLAALRRAALPSAQRELALAGGPSKSAIVRGGCREGG